MNSDIRAVLRHAMNTYFEPPRRLPTTGVTDAPLTGNGDIGVAAGGGKGCCRLYVSKNDMWCAMPHHHGGGMKSLALIEFEAPGWEGCEFRAWQDMEEAQIVIELAMPRRRVRFSIYVPRDEYAVVTRIDCLEGSVRLNARLSVQLDPLAEISYDARDGIQTLTKNYTQNVTFETRAAATLRVLDRQDSRVVLNAGEGETVATIIATNHDREEPAAWAQAMAAQIDDGLIDQWRRHHSQWWDSFWDESGVLIPDEPKIEKYWFSSQYLLACCCKKGAFAPGIFGNFVTNDSPGWGADYHLNYNYEAPWWGVYSSNKAALSEPYDVPLMEYIEKARENARTKLNCRGIYSKVGIGPKGYECSQICRPDDTPVDDAAFWGQKSNTAYAATDMLMRFYHTYDEEYAKRYAYPYVLEVASFWEDYLAFEGGRYIVTNDAIHENAAEARGCFDWVKEDATDYHSDMNSVLTLGLLRMLFKGALDMSELLGADEARRGKWQHILDHLSGFPTQWRGGREVFRYTERGMDWNDSNTLGIQHVYPAGAIGLSSDERLLTIARNTLEELDRWRDFNGFPTFFPAAVRVGYDPELILRHMNEQLRLHGLPNLYVYYGGGGIECLSAVPSTVNDMLVQSHEGILRFFPVWDRSKDAAFIKLRTYGAFVVSGALRGGQIGQIELLSEKGRAASVLCPWQEGMTITLDGAEIEAIIEETRFGSVYHFDTTAGAAYRLCQRGKG